MVITVNLCTAESKGYAFNTAISKFDGAIFTCPPFRIPFGGATRVGVGDIPNKKTCPLCRKDFLNIMVKSNFGGEEELVNVPPVTQATGGETLAPQASDDQEFPDWGLLRLNAPPPPPHLRTVLANLMFLSSVNHITLLELYIFTDNLECLAGTGRAVRQKVTRDDWSTGESLELSKMR